jgi:hypothetical protein
VTGLKGELSLLHEDGLAREGRETNRGEVFDVVGELTS